MSSNDKIPTGKLVDYCDKIIFNKHILKNKSGK